MSEYDQKNGVVGTLPVLPVKDVAETLKSVKHAPHAHTERFQAELNVIQANLELAMRKVRDHRVSQRSLAWLGRLVNGVEACHQSQESADELEILLPSSASAHCSACPQPLRLLCT